jgi:hypothetical protein
MAQVLWERPLEDIEGWNWTAFIHPDDVAGIVEKWRQIRNRIIQPPRPALSKLTAQSQANEDR